jgi:hypothetical protein
MKLDKNSDSTEKLAHLKKLYEEIQEQFDALQLKYTKLQDDSSILDAEKKSSEIEIKRLNEQLAISRKQFPLKNVEGDFKGEMEILRNEINYERKQNSAKQQCIEKMEIEIKDLKKEVEVAYQHSTGQSILTQSKNNQKDAEIHTLAKSLQNTNQEKESSSKADYLQLATDKPDTENDKLSFRIIDLVRGKSLLEWKLTNIASLFNLYKKDSIHRIKSLDALVFDLEKQVARLSEMNVGLQSKYIENVKKLNQVLFSNQQETDLIPYVSTLENRLTIALSEIANLKQSEEKLLKDRQSLGMEYLKDKMFELEQNKHQSQVLIETLQEELLWIKSNSNGNIDRESGKHIGARRASPNQRKPQSMESASEESSVQQSKTITIDSLEEFKNLIMKLNAQNMDDQLQIKTIIEKADNVIQLIQSGTMNIYQDNNFLKEMVIEKDRQLFDLNISFKHILSFVESYAAQHKIQIFELPQIKLIDDIEEVIV